MKNWILDSILGADEPTPAGPVPAVPIIDTREIVDLPKRTAALTRLIELTERNAAIEKIFGSEMLDMIKNPADSPGEPSTSTFQGQTLLTPVPEHISDPRKIDCKCPCGMCRTGSGCWNCMSDPETGQKCEFHSLRILDELIPVDPEEHQAQMEQAAKRQRARIADARIAQHRKGLEPAFLKFQNAIPYGYRPRIVAAVDRVREAASRYCAEFCG